MSSSEFPKDLEPGASWDWTSGRHSNQMAEECDVHVAAVLTKQQGAREVISKAGMVPPWRKEWWGQKPVKLEARDAQVLMGKETDYWSPWFTP